MKKCLFALIVIALSVACAKEKDFNTVEEKTVDNKTENTAQAGEMVTISATLPEDLLTKVSFDPTITSDKPIGMALSWEKGDQIRVYNHADHSQYEDFTLDPSCDGQKKGIFNGTAISAASYDIEVINPDLIVGTQEQAADGDTAHLKYYASVEGVGSYDSITFSDLSSVLALTAKMPSTAVAASITSVDVTASEDIFGTGNTLTLNLTTPGSADDILHLYANLPMGTKAIPAGTTLIIHFNSNQAAHSVYTRYVELGASNFTAGKLNTININASNSATYANASATSIGESTNPYLIGDKYQMQAISLSTTKQYYKLVDDIDLDGVTWTSLNADGTGIIDLDGNGKTISHLNKPLFDDLNGKVINLTIEDAVVDGGSSITGILANTIKTAASTVTNVDIEGTSTTTPYSSSVTSSGNVGGLIGAVTNVDGAQMLTASDCDIRYTQVSGASTVGGFLGYANAKVAISNGKYIGSTVSGSGQYIAGFVARTANYASTFTSCSVENATVTGSKDQDIRMGGFVGLLEQNCVVKGSSVGTSTTKVVISNTTNTEDSKVLNIGGFAGVCYGRITKDDTDNRSKSFVNITSANTKGQPVKIGGFVGYHTGNISYSDAVVDMSTLKGQYIGGFAGWAQKASASKPGSFDNCTIQGAVNGNNYTGGFLGFADSGNPAITNNKVLSKTTVTGQSAVGGFVGYTVSGVFTDNTVEDISVSSTGSNVGGFAGWINNGTFNTSGGLGNKTAASVTSSGGSPLGGFAGYIVEGTLSNCSATGDVTQQSGKSIGGFIGRVYNNGASFAGGNVSLTECHSEGNIIIKNNTTADWIGGFIGLVYADKDGDYALTISKCYSIGNIGSSTQFARQRVGGFIGQINSLHWNVTIADCFSSGNVYSNNQVVGGFIAAIDGITGTASISRCFASGTVQGNFRVGGFIGFTSNANTSIVDCAAWNGSVTSSNHNLNNWSSGAFEGTAFPTATLTNNFRSPEMSLIAYWVPSATYDHPDVSGSSTATYLVRIGSDLIEANATVTDKTAFDSGASEAGRWAYHGKHSTTNRLSTLASTAKASGGLGWNDEGTPKAWDFTTDLPTLK